MSSAVFITDEFLLETEYARRLYHDYAERLPIIDYHCHLPVEQIANNQRWQNMSQIWLGGDHYKWRGMRSNGVPERYCTGDASDWEKFEKWAGTMKYLVRNPLYDWAHLELARYFGISDCLLGPDTAQDIWDRCNKQLASPEFSARGLMKQSNVVLVCTTDDPVDSLEHHKAIAADPSFGIQVLPTWRPDKGMAVENAAAFNAWVDKLEKAADIAVLTFGNYLEALRKRHDFFHAAGCRLADHGMEAVNADDCSTREAEAIFSKVRGGTVLSPDEVRKLRSAVLHEFGVMNHERGWTQQFHLGVMRNNSTRLFKAAGPDSGGDSIGDPEMGRPLARLFDRLDCSNQLARTILYNINPRDNALLVTLMGSFQDGSVPGKMQFGSGWWFLDQKDGMERQMSDLSRNGLLSRFVGMVTDSRSFLSYTRHEYFRRILCNLLGNDMARGFIPRDIDLVGGMVSDICYRNAAGYFGFNVPKS